MYLFVPDLATPTGIRPYPLRTDGHRSDRPAKEGVEMSDSYGSTTSGDQGTVDTAKEEAKDLTHTATAEAKNVAATAKDEAMSVAGDVKTQAKDLYVQTKQELTEQASTQQQRVASGLRAVGSELGSMADRSDGGVAGDLVRQAATRVSAAGSWLEARDPGGVIDEVKRFARRKPGVFILGAAVAGVVVGRLTRALASVASDEAGSSSSGSSGASSAGAPAGGVTAATVPAQAGVAGGMSGMPQAGTVPQTPAGAGAAASGAGAVGAGTAGAGADGVDGVGADEETPIFARTAPGTPGTPGSESRGADDDRSDAL